MEVGKPDSTARKTVNPGQFKPGHPGMGGRPPGARDAVSRDCRERLIEALDDPALWSKYLAAVHGQLDKGETRGVEAMLKIVTPRSDNLTIKREEEEPIEWDAIATAAGFSDTVAFLRTITAAKPAPTPEPN